eukprot:scaffold118670_cov37-Cyclotella_meneghiniana.AAC.3
MGQINPNRLSWVHSAGYRVWKVGLHKYIAIEELGDPEIRQSAISQQNNRDEQKKVRPRPTTVMHDHSRQNQITEPQQR